MIDSFTGEHAFLSNFYESPIPFGDEIARTVEHGYQAAKTADPIWTRRILDAGTPGQAKRLGQQAPMRGDWEAVKVRFMRELLERKFTNNHLDGLLLATRPHVLVEGNSWGDDFWGACWRTMVTPHTRWAERDGQSLVGLNMLGRLLMEIRDSDRG